MDWNEAAKVAKDTVDIIKAGCYTTPTGKKITIGNDIIFSKGATTTYTVATAIPPKPSSNTTIEVVNETAMSVAARLTKSSLTVAILNFASGKNPGGGFLRGAIAQEECLARSSALFACLESHEMYPRHKASKDPMYSATMIYSPRVLFFKDDDGNLLEEPYRCSVLTAPAVNASEYLKKNPGKDDAIKTEMKKRIEMALGIFAAQSQTHIILGAWGCGAFGNKPDVIAGLFKEALDGPFKNVFEVVVFAVMDNRPNTPIFNEFKKLS